MSVPAKTERLSCRITPAGKRLLEHVAARHGMSISNYFVNLAVDIASRELSEELVSRITPEEWETLLAELDADAEPNEKLAQVARAFARGMLARDIYHAPDYPGNPSNK